MRRVLRGALLALAMWPGVAVQAQVSGTITLMSDYRYRGISLSGGEPAHNIAVNVDTSWGIYAGLAHARARMRYTEVDGQLLGYVGYARQLRPGLAWDVGLNETRYTGGARYDYREVHAGLSWDRLGARIYSSPHYFGVGGRSLYAEIGGTYPLGENVDVVAHLGHLARPQQRTDLRLGLSWSAQSWTAQLAWVAARDKAPLYPALQTRDPRKLVLSVTHSF